MTFRGASLITSEAVSQQDALGHVEPAVSPRVDEPTQVIAQQVVVHEGLVLLVSQIGEDYLREEVGVLAAEEKAQLV